MKIGIQIGLAIAIVVLSYLVYDSINSKVVFDAETVRRKEIVVERLKDLRTIEMAYKSIKGAYSKDFNAMLNFVKNEKMPIIKRIGDAEDSIQVARGLVKRDTMYINLMDTLFSANALKNRLAVFYLDSLPYIPFSGGEKFLIDAGEIEKNKVKVKVFEISAAFGQIYKGMDAQNQNVKINEGLRVGSMTEPSTNGNWE